MCLLAFPLRHMGWVAADTRGRFQHGSLLISKGRTGLDIMPVDLAI